MRTRQPAGIARAHLRGHQFLNGRWQGLILLADDVGAGDIVPRLIGGFTREDRARGMRVHTVPPVLLLDRQVVACYVGAVGVDVVALSIRVSSWMIPII